MLYHLGDFAYPKPSHAKSALIALVMTRPYVSIIGKITETAIAMNKARNALNTMLAMCYRKEKCLLTGAQPALQRFGSALGQLDKQQLEEAQYPSSKPNLK